MALKTNVVSGKALSLAARVPPAIGKVLKELVETDARFVDLGTPLVVHKYQKRGPTCNSISGVSSTGWPDANSGEMLVIWAKAGLADIIIAEMRMRDHIVRILIPSPYVR